MGENHNTQQESRCNERFMLQMLKGALGVEDAVAAYFELPSDYNSEEEDDEDGNDISHLGSQHMHHMQDDYIIPTGASQSTNPIPLPNHMDTSHQGRRPAKAGSGMNVPVPSLLTQPAPLHTESSSQSQSQQLSVRRQQSGSGSLGSTLGRERTLAGAMAPSRLGAAGQGRATAPSQQVTCPLPTHSQQSPCVVCIVPHSSNFLLYTHPQAISKSLMSSDTCTAVPLHVPLHVVYVQVPA